MASIQQVAYVPELTANLLSVSCDRKGGLEAIFKADDHNPEFEIVGDIEKPSGSIVMKGIEGGFGLFEILSTFMTRTDNTGELRVAVNQVD